MTENHDTDFLVKVAEGSACHLSVYTTVQIQSILESLAQEGKEKASFYAQWSVEETGCGNIDDNVKKYQDCMTDLMQRYQVSDFTEPRYDCEKKIISFPKPAGVLVALIPSTNPIMTIYYKTVISIMTRNAIIFSPHPKSKECSLHAVDFMAQVAESAGAPKGTVQVIRKPGIEPLNNLMRSPRINLILATGGPGRVKEAYRSGNPAFGMGPGNVPCFVHQSAEVSTAAYQIVASNCFDHSLPCVCESVIIADSPIDKMLKTAIGESSGCFIDKKDETALRAYLFPEGQMNPEAIGKSAMWIAGQSGIAVPPGTKSLIVPIEQVGPDEPLSQEKMFPVMGYIVVDGVGAAVDTALTMLNVIGKGHSAVVHSNDPSVVTQYTKMLPVCRIAVNTKGVEGSGGVSTHLTSGPVVGTGFFGGSTVDENVGPQHLVQWSRAAYPKDATFPTP